MASPVNANIFIDIETAKAQAQLKALQGQVTALNASMAASAGAKGFELAGMGKATQQITQITSATSNLNKQLLSGSRGFISSYKGIKNSFKEGSIETALATKNVAALNAQYKLLGASAATATTAIKTVGVASAMSGNQVGLMTGQMSIALQSMNQMGTAAQTWGKNMQWAGRQLVIGFTVPLTIFAAVAVKSFQDVEKEMVNLRKVYGDFGTSGEEVERVTEDILELSKAMTALGFTAKETIGVAAEAAAIGYVGDELVKITEDVSKFAALGNMAQTEALNTLVSVNTAFGVSAKELAGEVDFLNAVENQTILSMQDMSEAIPITAAAIKGLGGDIRDLAVFMTAMREGGINANEAANSLKTSLARLITPTKQATETATAFGISIDNIVNSNEGDLMGMVQSLGTAMERLSDLQQQQLLSDLFGKRQFARMGALFNNLGRDASQAATAMELTTMAAEDLALVSEKELNALKDSGVMQLTKQMESLKLAMAPIGEMVANFISPILSFGEKMLSAFNGLDEGVKKAIGAVVLVVGLAIPAFAMFLGLVGNLVGSITKFIATVLRFIFAQNTATGAVTLYNTELTEEIALSNAVTAANNAVTVSINQQTTALNSLIANYQRLAATRMSGGQAAPPLRMATGGKVPGTGNTDKIPALLTPGEYVINKKQSQKHSGFLKALNTGSVSGFQQGFTPDVERMIDTGVGSGFSEQRATQIIVEAAAEAGVVFGQTGSKALKDGITQSLQKSGYSGHGGKGVFNTQGTQNSHLAEGEGYDFDTLDVDKLNKTTKPGQELIEFKKAGGFANSEISGRLTGLTDFTSHLPAGSNQGSRQDKPLNAESWHAAWTANEQKTKAAFRDQAKALLDAKKITDQEYLEILASVEQSYDKIDSDLARLKADTSHGPGGKMMTEGEVGGLIQTKMRESGGEKLVDTLTQEGEGARMSLDVPDEIKAKAERTAAVQRELDRLIAKEDEELSGAYDERIASLEAQKTILADEGYSIKEYDGKESRSKPGSGSKKKQVKIDESVSGMPEGFDLVRRDKFEVRTSADGAVAGQDMTRRFMEGSGTGAKFYQNAGKDAVAVAQETQAELRRIAESNNLIFEDIEQTARKAGASIPEALAEGIRQNTSKPEMAARELAGSIPDVMNSAVGAASPAKATEQVGKNIDEGLAQGIRNNADDPVVAAKQVGEQMAFAFDESFDGNAVGRDAMQETEQGMRTGGTGTGGTGTGKGKKDPGVAPPNKRRMEGGQMAQMGIGMGISALSTLPMMMGKDNIMGVSSEFTMGIGMATGQIASFSSMLGAAGPYVAGFAAAAGVAMFAIEAYTKSLDKASDEAYELGASLGGAAGAANTMSEALGKATAIQKRSNIAYDDSEKQNAEEFAAAFGSEGGKALVDKLAGTFGAERNALAAQYIETAVFNGMIESDQARTFAKALANQLGDPGLVNRLSGTLQGMESPDYTRTQAARSVAEKKDKAISQDSMIGKNGGITSVGKTIGAAAAALADFASLSAVAEAEYAEGIISYKEYIETLNLATEAQSKYSDMLNKAVESGTNSATTRNALLNALGDQGFDKDKTEEIAKRLEDARVEAYEADGKTVDRGTWIGDTLSNLGWIDKREDAESFDKLTDEEIRSLYGTDLIHSSKLDSATDDSLALMIELYAQLGDEQTARAVTIELMNEQSAATKAYSSVLRNTEDQAAAANAALGMLALQGTDSLLNDSKYNSAFTDAFGIKGVNPQLLQKMFSQGQNGNQLAKQFAVANGEFTKYENLGNMGEGKRTDFEGNGLDEKQRAEYINAMGSVAELIGPEMQSTLTPYVTENIAAGIMAGGTEGISELNEILKGDQEAVNAYIELALADGSLEKEEIKEIATGLAFINSQIPQDIQILLDINLKDPKTTKALLDDQGLVRQLSLLGEVISSLPEEEKKLGAKLAFDENGKPTDTKKFVKDLRSVRKEMGELDGKSKSERIDIIANIVTTLNGSPASPDAIAAAYQALEDEFGGNAINAMDSITLTTTINSLVDAEQLIDDAEAMELAASKLPIGSKEGKMVLLKQANGMRAAAGELQDSAFAGAATAVLNPTPDGGGGGGGGGDEGNWYKDLFETEDEKKDALERRKKLLEDNKKIAKENSRLNQEVIDALAADEDAYNDYMADVKKKGKAKANKDLNKAYFGNMKKDEREQTQEMKDQKRREDLVDLSDIDYFTKEQIKAQAKLLELYEKGGEDRKFAVEEAEKRANIETTALDKEERKLDLMREQNDLAVKSLELSISKSEADALYGEKGVFTGTGKDRESVEQKQKEIAAEINLIQLQSIGPIKDKIELQKRLIKEMEREYVINEDNIEDAKVRADAQRRIVEDMQRALEIRQREGAVLSHDLKLMGYMEEDINEAYDKRMEALDKTLSINQQIAQSQQQQLGLASALSRGDVSAAASAAQQMQQGAMENAANQFKSQLETSRDSQINSLTGADSGMTKDQITERQRQLEEESYYTNLQIRDIEDEIWGINRNIRNEQDIIDGYKDSIKENNRTIKDLEWEIYEAEQAQLTTLQDEQKENTILLGQADLAVAKAASNDKIALARFERNTAMWEQEQEFAIAKIKLEEELGKQMASNFSALKQMTKMANEYHKAISSGKGNTNIKMPTMKVSDLSILSMKYVSKSMEDFTTKLYDAGSSYGDKTASFNLPSASVGAKATSGIMGNITNNNMNNNVNVNAQGASAVEVADIVIRQLAIEKFKNIGGAG